MSDLISRQAAIDALKAHEDYKGYLHGDFEEILEALPSAQPEQKNGRWLPVKRCDGGYWVCSSCKNPTEAFAANVLYKYCPFCGADMRKQKLQYGDEDTSQGGLMSAT